MLLLQPLTTPHENTTWMPIPLIRWILRLPARVYDVSGHYCQHEPMAVSTFDTFRSSTLSHKITCSAFLYYFLEFFRRPQFILHQICRSFFASFFVVVGLPIMSITSDPLRATTVAGRRRVRFEMEGDQIKTNVSHSTFVRETFDDARLWWQNKEFDTMKKSAYTITHLIKEGDASTEDNVKPSYSKVLSQAYNLATSGKDVDKSTLDELTFWIAHGHSRRGLEKFVLDDMRRDVMKRRQRTVAAVLFMQDKCFENNMTEDQSTHLIRAVSERLSLPATRMALVMGAADMLAVSNKKQQEQQKIRRVENEQKSLQHELKTRIVPRLIDNRSPLQLSPRIITNRSA